ncbi:MAG TPA: type II secretion system F family protein [Mycobacteriales bacterium]|jgi:Flp pilus assembly protein TadB|nr:type II secretion system F family protein [Mycobacteriales bacterium]
MRLIVIVIVLAGAGVGAGGYWAALALTAAAPSLRLPSPSTRARTLVATLPTATLRGTAALGAALAAFTTTKWPAAAVGAAGFVFARPHLRSAHLADASIARLEALAAWIETMRDLVKAGSGLEAAISRSVATVPPVIAEPVTRFADAVEHRMPITDALHVLADELNDGDADRVVAALIITADARGAGLADLLRGLAKSTRDHVAFRRRTRADRRSAHRGVQLLLMIWALLGVGIVVFNRGYLRPYDSPTGQLVLAFVFILTGTGLGWMQRLTRVHAPARFLRPLDVANETGAPT